MIKTTFSSLKEVLAEDGQLIDRLREICFLLMGQLGSDLFSTSAPTDRRVFHFSMITHPEGMVSDNRIGMIENCHPSTAGWAQCDSRMPVVAGITQIIFL